MLMLLAAAGISAAPGRTPGRAPAAAPKPTITAAPGGFLLFSLAPPVDDDEEEIDEREARRLARIDAREQSAAHWREVCALLPTARIAEGIRWEIPEPRAKAPSKPRPAAPKSERDMSPLPRMVAPGAESAAARVYRLGIERRAEVIADAERRLFALEEAARNSTRLPIRREVDPDVARRYLAEIYAAPPLPPPAPPPAPSSPAGWREPISDDEIPF